MILSIRKNSRLVVTILLFIFLQTYSVEVYALTSGPAQEEYASFEPVGTTDMVNLYSGDFTYNIPLLSVPGPNGGYPINLAYHSGIGMEQEASWVGLGWNVNVGAINRNLRGLPDDFDGDEVTHEQHMRKNWTVGLNLFQKGEEFFGFGGSSGKLQVYYNNYIGVGYRVRTSLFSKFFDKISSATSQAVNLGISVSYDPHEGIGVGTNLGVSVPFGQNYSASLGVSGSWNSRQGLQGMTVSGSVNADYVNVESKDSKGRAYATRRHELNASLASTGATFNFSQGVPAVTMAMRNTMFTTDLKLGFTTKNLPGGGIFKTEFPFDWTGNYSESQVRNGTIRSKAYGYMNSEHASERDLKDFSYTPIAYNNKLPYLSPSNVTNDVFSIAGQGTGGMYRGYRADIGIFHQRNTYSITEQHRLSLEGGITPTIPTPVPPTPICPSIYQFGLGALPPTLGIAEDKTGAWEDGLGDVSTLKNFKNPADYPYLYDKEVKLYKDITDRPAIIGTSSMYDVWKGEEPIKLEIHDNSVPKISVQGISAGVDKNASDFREKTTKTPRTRVINALTRNQAVRYGVSKNYEYYGSNNTLVSKYTGNTDYHKTHHTSEISILEADGMRYIYGLPAYNMSQEDASFSVEKNTTGLGNPNPTIATPAAPGYHQANSEWSKQPEYLNKTQLPPYAHSWMLTSVLSADYVDVTGDGLSEDDLGYWVDFKYKKTTSNYHWRAPYENSIYMPGTGQDFDDKGSYSKGVKELFYLAEVRTKTHVAIYETEDRDDAIGASATNHNGGLPNSIQTSDRMQKLKKITLYTLQEYNNNQYPEPLKTVHFVYMDEANALCKGVPNHANAGGKLTLKKVYFTYGKSNKGALSPYEFNYAANNPDYNLKNHDCWGNYQDNSTNNYPYHEFPYTNQNPDPDYQAPWHLTTIKLPTGGTLNIQYEQDDYAYVEDKKAMQLYDIAFTGDGDDFNNLGSGNFSQRGTPTIDAHSSSLRNGDHHDANSDIINPDFEYRIYFPLKTPIPDNTHPNANTFYGATPTDNIIAEWFKKHYVGETKDLYFKSAVKLQDNPTTGNPVSRDDERVDFVAGYAELRTTTPLSHYGVDKSPSAATNEYDIGYITVQPTIINAFGGGRDKIHPIRDAAFQHIRFARPELVNGTQTPNDILSLFNVIPDILSSLMGYKYYYKTENYASEIFLDGFSQIRLLVPDGKKIGGGVRVKKLTISDNWTDMAGATYQSSDYGQVYDYTTIEDGKTISSGVAYEPFAGKEQNPLVTPVRYKHSNPLQNPNNLFLENPVLMRHYPGASVGYRKVTVKSLSSSDDNSKETRVPYTEYEFYSPKEFPIKVKKTDPDKTGAKYKIIPIPGIYTEFQRNEGMSQGYTIIFNDMAGKMKSVKQKTYKDIADEYDGEVISSQKYEYYTQNNDPSQLNNEVDVFTGEGIYEKAKLGIDYDIQVHMNEQKQSSDNFALDLNLIGGVLPYCIPIPVINTGGASHTSSSLKTAVVLKLISKSGILKSTTVTNQNSTITTENLVFDKMTGEPLLTKTKNEFKDDIYAYNQKAYWHYEGMAEAFKNTGAVLNDNYTYDPNIEGYNIIIPTSANLSEFPLVEGDEVNIEHTANSSTFELQATVFSIAGTGMNREVKFADRNGQLVEVDDIVKITITRSGRRNLLAASAGAIAAMNLNYVPDATIGGGGYTLLFDENSKILNASAMTYRDYWPTDKSCERVEYCSETKCISFDAAKGEINASNLISKIDDGSVTMTLNGEPLTSSDIIVGNNCTPDTRVRALCTGVTDPDFTVEYELGGVTTVVPHVIRSGTRCGDVNTGEFSIPCAPGQNDNDRISGTHVIKVDGQVWGTDITFAKANSRCEYAYGRWNLAVPTGTNGGSHVVTDYNCMIGNYAVHISDIKARYTSDPTTTYTIDKPWGTIPPSSNPNAGPLRPLVEHLDVVTQEDPETWQVAAGHARAYIPLDKANSMQAFDHFYLQSYDNNGVPQPFCYPSHLPAPKGPEMKYNFDYEPAAFHGFVVKQLSPGPHNITYETSGGDVIGSVHSVNIDQNAAIPIIEMDVELPAGISVDLILRDPTGAIINTIINVQVPSGSPHGIQVAIPNLSVGNNQLDVAYNNTTESYNLICDADDTQSSVLQCADGSVTTLPTLPLAFYQEGAKGRWRPWASYTYVSNRYYGDTTTPNPSIREKGVFEDFTPFSWVGNNVEQWQWASRTNQYMAEGYEVESVDALGNYSAALYDYQDNLAVAVAKNARYHEIMFDGFETAKECDSHSYITDGQDVVSTHSHTGEQSYSIAANSIKDFESITLNAIDEEACADKLVELDPVKYVREDILDFLLEGKETPNMKIPKIMRTATANSDPSAVEALPKECGCLGKFAPKSGKKYHLSAWIKRDLAVHDVVHYQGVYIAISFRDESGVLLAGTTTLLPLDGMIEKWQRISGDFEIPAAAAKMYLAIHNSSTANDATIFLDDLRIMPSESSMATYVYDKTTLRNTATLDDNNFATFYIYDEEGKLIKTKKETPEGIKTINEGRQHVRGPL